MLIISPKILEEGTLNNMDHQQGYTDNLLLIPGPSKDGALSPGTWDQFRMILKIILKKESKKRQASSVRQRLTMVQG